MQSAETLLRAKQLLKQTQSLLMLRARIIVNVQCC